MIEADRIISAAPKREEEVIDRAIRPKLLADYVGQPSVREQMEIFIKAAKLRNEALDHLLIFGPPGLGKTTLANIGGKYSYHFRPSIGKGWRFGGNAHEFRALRCAIY